MYKWGWTDHNGAECPVNGDEYVIVGYRDGTADSGLAGGFRWCHSIPGDADIVRDADILEYCVRKKEESDVVNKPSHYQILPGVEVYDIREALFNKIPPETDFKLVSDWERAWEYLTRMWGKNGLEDAKKARWYLNKLIESLEKN